MLVSPNWLASPSTSKNLVIIDCRFSLADPQLGHQQYLESPISGAYYLDLNQDLAGLVQRHGGRHPLPDLPMLAAKLSQMGITADTTVVAYDNSRFAFAARLWWLLKYMGHNRTAVLDGGFSAYQAAGLPITSEVPPERSGLFVPTLRPNLAVDRAGVQKREPKTKLIDSREGERYRGEREPIDPVAGHIPGALNYPWQQVTDENGKMRSPQDLRDHWSDIAPEDDIMVYCGSGVTACVNLLALETAGIQTGKLYVGSWSDWCSYPLDSSGKGLQ
jgi:thiosulfate/3-mercaptopyruvate sulfurtransferase